MIKKLTIHIIGLVSFCLFADYLMRWKPFGSNEFWGLFDGGVHATISMLVLLPFARKGTILIDLLTFLVIGGAIDIDHFIQAQSFSVSDVIALPLRPASHSFTFIILLSIIVFSFNKRMGIILLLGLSSHIIRDASSGVTPIFYPLEFYRIPYFIYIISECFIVLASYYIFRLYFRDKICNSKVNTISNK